MRRMLLGTFMLSEPSPPQPLETSAQTPAFSAASKIIYNFRSEANIYGGEANNLGRHEALHLGYTTTPVIGRKILTERYGRPSLQVLVGVPRTYICHV